MIHKQDNNDKYCLHHTEEVTPTKPMIRCSHVLVPNNGSITVNYSNPVVHETYIIGTTAILTVAPLASVIMAHREESVLLMETML